MQIICVVILSAGLRFAINPLLVRENCTMFICVREWT